MKAYLEPLREISEYCAVEQELLSGHRMSHITGCIDSQKCHLIAGLSEHFPVRVIITYILIFMINDHAFWLGETLARTLGAIISGYYIIKYYKEISEV